MFSRSKILVLTMHGFSNAGYLVLLGFISVVTSMSFWFRDVIAEGTCSMFMFVVMITVLCYYGYIEIPHLDVCLMCVAPVKVYKNADTEKKIFFEITKVNPEFICGLIY
jgi:hypothetical protein